MAIKLIVGLGNPGPSYENTRHNAGFWAVDQVAHGQKIGLVSENKFFGNVGRFKFKNNDVFLLKPSTFMNLSGKAVLALANFYKINADEILVVHDELDFMPGVVKMKFGGGSGGHNGLRDIERVIGRDYWRCRVGIGHPGNKSLVHDYVLKKPSNIERSEINTSIDNVTKTLDLILAGDFAVALKELHTK